MYEETEDFQTTISVGGIYEPYFIDTWTGKVEKAANYSVVDGRTRIDIDIAPGETLLLALRKHVEQGESRIETSRTEIPLTGWTLMVDSFTPSEKMIRTEQNPDTGVETTEVAYDTSHVTLDAGTLDELVAWKDIEAVGESVSGIGTYTITFEADEVMLSADSVTFRADSFCGGTAAVFVNGVQVPVNMDRRTADVTGCIVEGENTLEVRVTSSLRNVMREVGYDQGWIILHPDAADYGMIGDAIWLNILGNILTFPIRSDIIYS